MISKPWLWTPYAWNESDLREMPTTMHAQEDCTDPIFLLQFQLSVTIVELLRWSNNLGSCFPFKKRAGKKHILYFKSPSDCLFASNLLLKVAALDKQSKLHGSFVIYSLCNWIYKNTKKNPSKVQVPSLPFLGLQDINIHQKFRQNMVIKSQTVIPVLSTWKEGKNI